jgi:hypothetical protein
MPQWPLLKQKSTTLQYPYSRGCPFQCEFCDITTLFGRVPRTKTAAQIIRELDAIYETGWRGELFFVDDNFISNRKKLIEDVLPAITEWMETHELPFCLMTEVSINLADDEELMHAMVKAGFNSVFVGIETPDDTCLTECRKTQNRNRDLTTCVRKIQEHGMEVMGGFIVGFDSDNETIFSRMIKFIQESGVVTAMVGLLNAPIGSKLYERLHKEGRIENSFTGNNTDYSMNFKPKMDRNVLEKGYKQIVKTFTHRNTYERVVNFLSAITEGHFRGLHPVRIRAFFRPFSAWASSARSAILWKLLKWSSATTPPPSPSPSPVHLRLPFQKSCMNIKRTAQGSFPTRNVSVGPTPVSGVFHNGAHALPRNCANRADDGQLLTGQRRFPLVNRRTVGAVAVYDAVVDAPPAPLLAPFGAVVVPERLQEPRP